MFKATLQAVDSETSISTGNYDDTHEYKKLTIEELKSILFKLINITLLEVDLDKDTCPANIVIETEIDSYTFIPSGNKKLYCDNSDSYININEALSLISGNLSIEKIRNIPKKEKSKAVRYPNVAPSMSNITSDKIDTSSNSQQIQARVWKSKGWQETKVSLISFAIIFCIIGFLLIEEDKELALSMFGIMGVLILLLLPNSWIGHCTLRLGIDLKTNTIWVEHASKLFWVLNANQVTHLSVNKFDETLDFNIAAAITTDGAATGGGKVRTWLLKAHYSDGHKMKLIELATKKEAQTVLSKSEIILK